MTKKSSLNIMLVISDLSCGGAENVITRLANHWAQRGFDVTLVTLGGAAPYYPLDYQVKLRQLNLAWLSRPIWRAVSSGIDRVRALRRALRESQPDVVISFLFKVNILTLLATRGLQVPVIVSERNNPGIQRSHLSWRLLRKPLYGLAKCVVTPSRGVLEWFPESIKARGHVIPNPVDLPKEAPDPGEGQKKLISVGRLVPQKGFDLLLQAFNRIASDFPDWNLVIRGEGEERHHLEQLRDQLGLHDRVRLPGVTDNPGEWVREGEIFVLSSRYEGFGIVITEAMAAGLAIVSFDCPWGPGEILSHQKDAILVPPKDVASLSRAMASLMCDAKLRQDLGRTATRNVQRFDQSLILKQWDALLKELTGLPAATVYTDFNRHSAN
jgi:glycosyltransferase involved in cell wall biosynthesis